VRQTLVGYTRRPGSLSRSYEQFVEGGKEVLDKVRREDPDITDSEYHAFLARDLFGVACLSLIDDSSATAWSYLSRALRHRPGIILRSPRRWGVIAMLALSSTLPERGYRHGALRALGRTAFGIKAGEQFDSLA